MEEIIRDDYQVFITKKRSVTAELYREYNNTFIENRVVNKNLISYQSEYTGTIVLFATEEQIKSLARDITVEEITYWHNYKPVAETCTINKQIGSDVATGTKSSNYNNGSGYFGNGVKIGIIEAESGRYDPDVLQLKDVPSSHLEYVSSKKDNESTLIPEISDHATVITSIIVGSGYAYAGTEFESIAPGAKVYQMSIDSENGLYRAFDKLVSKGVSVINFSGGFPEYTTAYSNVDRQIDRMIYNTGVTFVTSAGNTDTSGICVTSPGKAYNAITVGNAFTKGQTAMDSELSIPYSINSSLSYAEKAYLSNKPDLVAPGTNIVCNVSETGISMFSGSSLSAAIVTGVVAQLHEADYDLAGDVILTKAILLAGADKTIIYDDYDNTNRFGEKSGAGFVNAENSIKIANSKRYLDTSFHLQSCSVPTYRSDKIYLTAGQVYRFVMTYNKPEDYLIQEQYKNDVDIELLDPNGNVVKYSRSKYHNVEVMEYTVPTTGSYYYRLTLANKDATTNGYLDTAFAWHVSKPQVKATFNANGGTCSTSYKNVTRGSTYGTLPTPTRSGYTFVGWHTAQYAEGNEVKSTTKVSFAKDHTLYAHWAKKYKITNVGANKCLNIYGDNVTSLSDGVNITLWSNSGTNEQKWLISGLGKDQQFIRSVIDKTYGLNVYRTGDPYNCNIHKIIGNEVDAQIDIIPTSVSGQYKLKLTNYDLYLTAASSADGSNVYWAAESTSNYQKWKFTVVS